MTYEDKIQDALKVADEHPKDLEIIEFSTGVKLKVVPEKINQFTLQKVIEQFAYPSVKEYSVVDDNGRVVDNPDHPEYKRRMDETNMERGMAAVDYIATVATVPTYIPEEIYKIEDDAWIDNLEYFTGIKVSRDHRLSRYRMWITHVAMHDEHDLKKLLKVAGLASGESEESVAQAINGFPNN